MEKHQLGKTRSQGLSSRPSAAWACPACMALGPPGEHRHRFSAALDAGITLLDTGDSAAASATTRR